MLPVVWLVVARLLGRRRQRQGGEKRGQHENLQCFHASSLLPHRTMPWPPPVRACDGRSVPWIWEWHWLHLVVKATFMLSLAVGVLALAAADLDHVLLGADEAGVEVELVALQAEHGLVGGEQVVGHRSVRRWHRRQLLDRLVLEDERPLLVLVAGVAEVVEPHVAVASMASVARVRVVAARAVHLALAHRVVVGQLELRRRPRGGRTRQLLSGFLSSWMPWQSPQATFSMAWVEACHGQDDPSPAPVPPMFPWQDMQAVDVVRGPVGRRCGSATRRPPPCARLPSPWQPSQPDLPPVDLERLDPHVDLVGHAGGDLVVAVGAHRPVRRNGGPGERARRGERHQQNAPVHHRSSLLQLSDRTQIDPFGSTIRI